jgi:hypothetical protein
VRRFGCFTANPRQMADWLCQWLLKLHTFGLRSNSFQHDEQIRILRTYWRYRDTQVKEAGCSIQRMQKTLTQMNIQLANAISDLSGLNRNANPPGDTGGRARWQ